MMNDVPLAFCMEINTADRSFNLIEADVVESLEAGSRDGPNTMIRNEEVLFPSHEHVLALGKVSICKISSLGLFGKRLPGRKSGPVVDIYFLVGAPLLVSGLKCVLGADDFPFKKGGQSGVIFSQT